MSLQPMDFLIGELSCMWPRNKWMTEANWSKWSHSSLLYMEFASEIIPAFAKRPLLAGQRRPEIGRR
jgi:hypothetical protein